MNQLVYVVWHRELRVTALGPQRRKVYALPKDCVHCATGRAASDVTDGRSARCYKTKLQSFSLQDRVIRQSSSSTGRIERGLNRASETARRIHSSGVSFRTLRAGEGHAASGFFPW